MATPSPLPARRHDGKKVALVLGALLVIGTIVATAIGYVGHQYGAEARRRFDDARAAEHR